MPHSHGTDARQHLLTIIGGLILLGFLLALPDVTPAPVDEFASPLTLHGRIVDIVTPLQESPDGRPPVATARVQVLEGPRTGEVIDAFLEGPGGTAVSVGFAIGEEVVVSISRGQEVGETYVAVADRWRLPSLALLTTLFGIVVLVIGGWRGARALVALGLTAVVLLRILIPLLVNGAAPVPLAVVAAAGITAMTILLTEGFSRASLAAILGTAGALSVTALLAAAASTLSAFTYSAGADLNFLATATGGSLDLRGILLAAIILGAVGVLDDVTVTQAVVVEELASRGSLRGRALASSALEIGRSHIGATVNTLFLAYVGAGLPLLVVLVVTRQPLDLVLNNEEIATEIVRTLVGSLGILAAVPFTTFVAVSLAEGARLAREAANPAAALRSTLRPVAIATGIVAVLLVAAALVPPGGAPKGAIANPTPAPSATTAPLATPSPVPLAVARGDAVDILLNEIAVGTVTVTAWTIEPLPADGSPRLVTVEVAYLASARWSPDPGAWALATADGRIIELRVAGLEGRLEPGGGATVSLAASTADNLAGGIIVYRDDADRTLFIVPLD